MSDFRSLMEKIKALPPEKVGEVEDFVDFIAARVKTRSLIRAAAQVSASEFGNVWTNPDDDAYDTL